jgi:hypothetical protein
MRERHCSNAAAPSIESCSIRFSKVAEHGNRLQEGFTAAATDGKRRIAAAQWLAASRALEGRKRDNVFGTNRARACGLKISGRRALESVELVDHTGAKLVA